MATSSSNASFSSLPPELRVKIFRYLMPTGTSIKPKMRVKGRREVSFPGRCLRVSKFFNAEAGPVFYSANRFEFKDLFNGVIFLKTIGKSNRTYLTELCFGNFWFRHKEAMELSLTYSTALEKITDWIAKSCPDLTHFSFGDVRQMGSGKWIMNTLEVFCYLIGKLPKVSKVYYSAKNKRLVLSAEPGEKRIMTIYKYEEFDIDGLTQAIKDKAKAKRSAGAKQAAATRKLWKARGLYG